MQPVMAREILFAAVRIPKTTPPTWEYAGKIEVGEEKLTLFPTGGNNEGVTCDPNTLSQYIGVSDVRGDSIFESDVLNIRGHLYVVDMSVSGYLVGLTDEAKDQTPEESFIFERSSQAKIVGNIHSGFKFSS